MCKHNLNRIELEMWSRPKSLKMYVYLWTKEIQEQMWNKISEVFFKALGSDKPWKGPLFLSYVLFSLIEKNT